MEITSNNNGEKLNTRRLKIKSQQFCYELDMHAIENHFLFTYFPLGEYRLNKNYTEKDGWHLQLRRLPERRVVKITPTSEWKQVLDKIGNPDIPLTEQGSGYHSMVVYALLKLILFDNRYKTEQVFISIREVVEKSEKNIKKNLVNKNKNLWNLYNG